MTKTISAMKAISLIKKAGLPYSAVEDGWSSSSGFRARKMWGGEVEISAYSVSFKNWETLAEAIIKANLDVPFQYSIDNYGHVNFILGGDPGGRLNLWNLDEFQKKVAPIIEEREKEKAIQKAEKERKAKEQAEKEARKMAKAQELNPNLKVVWLEGDVKCGVGQVTLHGMEHKDIYVLFSCVTEKAWWNEEKDEVSCHLYFTSSTRVGSRGSDRHQGSTTSRATTLEESLLGFVATWEVGHGN